MSFAQPVVLSLGLPLIVISAVFLVWAFRLQAKKLAQLGDHVLVKRLCANTNWRGRRLQAVLLFIGLLMLVIALARPQWGDEHLLFQQEGLQIMVVLDVSESMLAEDVDSTRLEFARQTITDLITRLKGNEIGLVLFSGASFMQVPLTTDYPTLVTYLDSAGPHAISRPGSNIGDALKTASRGFNRDQQSQRVILLFSDGEDRESGPVAMAQLLAAEDIIINSIGIGTVEGTQIPQTDSQGSFVGYKTDSQGSTVLTALDESTLAGIAEAGLGKYYYPTAAVNTLNKLVKEIGTLQTAPLESQAEQRKLERLQVFIGVALAALVIAELIPERTRHRRWFGWITSVRTRLGRLRRRLQRESAPSTFS